MPVRSTTRWYLEPALSRSAGWGRTARPFFRPDAEAVDARPVPIDGGLIAEPVQEPGVQLLADAGRLPVAKPSPLGRAAAAAQFLRQQAPRAASAEDEDVAGGGGAVRRSRPAALGLRRFFGQERLDGPPEIVGDEGFVLHGTDDAMPAKY